MRKQKNFASFGSIYQELLVKPGETKEIFSLEMPPNHVGFLYNMANDYFPLELQIDGEKISINDIMAGFDSPKLFDPPYLVNKSIKVIATNSSPEDKKIGFHADGIAYSILSVSEEILVNEIGNKLKEKEKPVKTYEKRPRHPHIINHYLKTADKWYEIKLPTEGVKAWSLRCRGEYDLNYCFEPSGATYMTLPKNETLSEDSAPQGIHAIYVRCSTEEVTIELELWRDPVFE